MAEPSRIGSVALELIASANAARQQFIETGREVLRYAYDPTHDFVYQGLPGSRDALWRAKVNKTAEYLEVIGPALFQNNPDRRVNPREWASPASKARAEILQQYLNFIAAEGNLVEHSRKAIIDALTYGAGVLWTGWNARRRVVQSVHESIENIYVDPTARRFEDIQWVARRREQPRWLLAQRYPDHAQRILGESAHARTIAYYEIYTLVGIHHFADGEAVERTQDGEPAVIDQPRKFVVTESGDVLEAGDWEIPFWKDDRWPFSLVAFRWQPGRVWPVSPLELGLPFQKAINFAYTFFMDKVRSAAKDIVAFAKVLGDTLTPADKARIKNGFGTQIVEIEVAGDASVRLTDLIQQWRFNAGVGEFREIVHVLERQFERMTGLSEFLVLGTTEHQFRSAAEATLKDRNARTRFEDMRIRVEQWQSDVARHEALAARILVGADDIARLFGPEAGRVWGELMPPPERVEATLLEQLRQAGVPPETAGPLVAQEMDRLRASGVVLEEWLHEAEYTIEAGSMRRQDIQQQIDATNEFMRQALPVLIGQSNGNPGAIRAGLAGVEVWAKINGMPAELRDIIHQAIEAMAQPPPQEPPPSPPQEPPPEPDAAMPQG